MPELLTQTSVNRLKPTSNRYDVRICLSEAERIAERWEGTDPRVAKQIRAQFEQTLAVHELPREHRRRMHTTNIMERVMEEIKRRTRVVGIFPRETSSSGGRGQASGGTQPQPKSASHTPRYFYRDLLIQVVFSGFRGLRGLAQWVWGKVRGRSFGLEEFGRAPSSISLWLQRQIEGRSARFLFGPSRDAIEIQVAHGEQYKSGRRQHIAVVEEEL